MLGVFKFKYETKISVCLEGWIERKCHGMKWKGALLSPLSFHFFSLLLLNLMNNWLHFFSMDRNEGSKINWLHFFSLLLLNLMNNQTKRWHIIFHSTTYPFILFHYELFPFIIYKTPKHILNVYNRVTEL